jgi:hypothetical protein
MSAAGLERALARLYLDDAWRVRFLADPAAALLGANLDASERSALLAIDRAGLELMARSLARKRRAQTPSR